MHAYRGAGERQIRLAARRAGDHFEISVSDDGPGLRPRPDSPGMGLGLSMLAQLSASIDIVSDEGTTVTMRWPLP